MDSNAMNKHVNEHETKYLTNETYSNDIEAVSLDPNTRFVLRLLQDIRVGVPTQNGQSTKFRCDHGVYRNPFQIGDLPGDDTTVARVCVDVYCSVGTLPEHRVIWHPGPGALGGGGVFCAWRRKARCAVGRRRLGIAVFWRILHKTSRKERDLWCTTLAGLIFRATRWGTDQRKGYRNLFSAIIRDTRVDRLCGWLLLCRGASYICITMVLAVRRG